MSNFRIRVEPTSVATLLRVLEATASHRDASPDQLADFSGLGKSTLSRALTNLQTLGLVTKSERGGFSCTDPGMKRGLNDTAAMDIVRRALISYRPFEAVCEGLALGESYHEAARKAGSLLGIATGELKKLEIVFRWAIDLGLVSTEAGSFKLAASIHPTGAVEETVLPSDATHSVAQARLYLASALAGC